MEQQTKGVSRSRATKYGAYFRTYEENAEEYRQAVQVTEQWRAQHVEPASKVFAALLREAECIPNAIATYRMKRMESIISKLRRPNNSFKLGALDDIGGCRLIVDTLEQVHEVVDNLVKQFPLKQGNPLKDYIKNPKDSGYRSCHLIVIVHDGTSRDYRIEIQVRTRLQHYWATAVEMASEMYGIDYKNPRLEDCADEIFRQRLRFFASVGNLFALEDGGELTANQSREQVIDEILNNKNGIDMLEKFKLIADDVQEIPTTQDDSYCYHMIVFSPSEQDYHITAFHEDKLDAALDAYSSREKITGRDGFVDVLADNTVLVYARQSDNLTIAYPNYSGKIIEFIRKVDSFLQ